jgi:NADH:ubiquinone oxidoreductase subunit 2 (subunit N)
MAWCASTSSLESAPQLITYIVLYGIAIITFYASILSINKDQKIASISSLKGLVFSAPWSGVTLSLSLFAMIGLPPFGNFVAKLELFKLLMKSGDNLLLTVSLFYAATSILYAAKIIIPMFRYTSTPVVIDSRFTKIAVVGCAILMLSGVFYSRIVGDFAGMF